jgi:AraC-like DNA-binding protein
MIDLLLRGGAITLLVLWATLAWSAPRGQRFYALACLCGAMFLAAKSPSISSALGGALAPVQALAVTGPLWFLAATRRALGVRPALTRNHLVVLGLCIGAVGLLAAMSAGPLRSGLYAVLDLVMLGLFLATLWSAWGGLADDLDPGRRAQRIALLIASAACGAAIAVSALAMNLAAVASTMRAPVETLIAATLFAAALALCLMTLRLREIDLRPRSAPSAPTPLAEKIVAVLERDRLYRTPNLTVAGLALTLAAPEHQVRAAINRDLGFRNFSAFINSYRLAEVKAALADPAQAQTPISTIALDAGFGSIASFNRVFSATFGMTPSDFRRNPTG